MTWASLIANALSVVVVAIYAWLTYRILQEMRRARERQSIPFVTISPQGGNRSDYRFRVRNDGNAVALGLFIDLVNPTLAMGTDPTGREMKLPGAVVPVIQRGALSPGDSCDVTVNLSQVDRTPYLMRAIYTNVHEQHFEVRQPFAREGDSIPGRPLEVEFFVDGRRIVGKPKSLEQFKPPEMETAPVHGGRR
jgi:hypothetical protein